MWLSTGCLAPGVAFAILHSLSAEYVSKAFQTGVKNTIQKIPCEESMASGLATLRLGLKEIWGYENGLQLQERKENQTFNIQLCTRYLHGNDSAFYKQNISTLR
ncbi:hypothetical protein Y1Q_0020846 [Alligator mississippiensis]|uniref:Uncharacterized protein n=1 Tax=Alligator mississippiensis TaxID=8496 RepID=A0A151NJ33_ALLMI|nr:hypothetical protein Y1Q_0020846 [Alligator mississippiensis]